MVKIRVLAGLGGKDYTFPKGSVQEVDDDKAKSWVSKGIAEWVGQPRTTQSRKAQVREKAVKPTPKAPEPTKLQPKPKQEPKEKPKAATSKKRRGRKPASKK